MLRSLLVTMLLLPLTLVPSRADDQGPTLVVPSDREQAWQQRTAGLQQALGANDSLLLPDRDAGGWNGVIDGLKQGWIDLAVLPLGSLRAEVPEAAIWYLPFIQIAPRAAEAAAADSGAFALLQKHAALDGWRIFALYAQRRILLSTHDCPASPAAFQGRKILTAPQYQPLIADLGAVSFTLPGEEVYSGLAKGIGTLTLVSVDMAVSADLPSIAQGVPDPKGAPFSLEWYAIVAAPDYLQTLSEENRQALSTLSADWAKAESEADELRFDAFFAGLNDSQVCASDATAWATFAKTYRQGIVEQHPDDKELLDILDAALTGEPAVQ